ncbi:hypothetical protein MOQ_006326 [Trypanosoma cruzi marinkellei]|uniref:Uncharacterized protein n=1 Tax=Trypanosoma cruzi marinkellei TaxID=85056 RepID=K2N5A1_TRYCR|nr:hypothetical protein MOQ_006326 [Trypanosoma cruzi marinkellei]
MFGYGRQPKPLQQPGLMMPQREHVMSGLYAVDSGEASSSANAYSASVEMNLSEKLTSWAKSLGKPLCCTSCLLKIQTTEKTVVYRLRTKYHVGDVSERRFALIFPVSGCSGVVTSILARINGRLVVGQLVRAEESASGKLRLFKVANDMPDENLTDKRQKHPVSIYSITPNASDVLDGKAAEVGADVIVEIRWISKEMMWCAPHTLRVLYPFVCAPRLPDEIKCRAVFSSPVKMVSSPNCRNGGGTLDWKLHRRCCKVRLTPQNAEKALRREDDVFILTLYFQGAFDSKYQLGTLAPVLLVIFLGIIVWMLLTKDLSV